MTSAMIVALRMLFAALFILVSIFSPNQSSLTKLTAQTRRNRRPVHGRRIPAADRRHAIYPCLQATLSSPPSNVVFVPFISWLPAEKTVRRTKPLYPSRSAFWGISILTRAFDTQYRLQPRRYPFPAVLRFLRLPDRLYRLCRQGIRSRRPFLSSRSP